MDGGCGEGAAIELAVGREGQGVEPGEEGGGRAARAGGSGGRAEGVGKGSLRERADDVGGEVERAGAGVARDDDRLGDGGMGGEDGFDFAELDADAAEFDLLVAAAEEVEDAVGAPAGAVAGGIHAGPGDGTIRVGDEAGGGERGLPVIAAGEDEPADVELAGDAGADRGECGIEDIEPGIGNGAADATGAAVGGQGQAAT